MEAMGGENFKEIVLSNVIGSLVQVDSQYCQML